MKIEEFFEGESYKKAAEKFEQLGRLGVTAEDHNAIGSTPPDRLAENPGKTLGELMSDEEIRAWLQGQTDRIRKYSGEEYRDNALAQSQLPELRKELQRAVRYLEKNRPATRGI